MNKTISMGLNQCLTKYPCSGHPKNRNLIDFQSVRFFLFQNFPTNFSSFSSCFIPRR